MIDVIYLYHDEPAAWEELRYSIRSLEKHLKEEFRIIIVSERLPDFLQGVAWVPMTHGGGSRYLDVSRKVEYVAEHHAVNEDLLFMYDDVYLIGDVPDAAILGAHHYQVPLADKISPANQHWYNLLKRTMDWLESHQFPSYNLETHLPRYFKKSKLARMLKQIPIVHMNMQRWTALGNLQRHDEQVEEAPKLANTIKAGFYGFRSDHSHLSVNRDEIVKACEGKLVLNHNDYGLTEAMRRYLKEIFPKQSKYERF